MPFATGPWHTPPQLPDDPEEWCLVLLFRRGAHYRYAVLRHADGWRLPNGDPLENGEWVSRWAYITSSVEHMSELPPVHVLPTESRLFVPDALSDQERLRLLAAYITELKQESERLHAEIAHLQEALGGPEADVRAEVRRLKGLLKHEQDVRASQTEAHQREKLERGERISKLEAEAAELRAQLRKAQAGRT